MEKVIFESLFKIPLRNGVTKPKKVRGQGYKMVNMGEIFSYSFIENIKMDRVPLTSKEKQNSFLEDQDLLFARQSLVLSGAGKCSIFISDKEDVCFESHIIRCRLNKETVNPLYYFYYFNSVEGRENIKRITEQGAGAAGIRGSELSKLEVPFVEKKIQDKVVDTLYSYDKKIQLNTDTNRTLEQIAQTVFQHWFIDFAPVRAKAQARAQGKSAVDIERAAMMSLSGKTADELTALATRNPTAYTDLQTLASAFPDELTTTEHGEVPKGWEYKKITDVCNVVYGKGLPKNKLKEHGFPVYGANGVIGYSENYLYEKPQVLIGCRGTVGKVSICEPFSFVTSNSLVIEYEKSNISLYYLERFLKNKDLSVFSSGSVQPQITIQNISKLEILIPSKEVHSLFVKRVNNLYEKIYMNNKENLSLGNTRDVLLPQLLNGEVKL
ncbi:restriction endonuclease subunit S [Pasteurellaceae bacterium HPA106]|uniref:restriction endonuclease subunit S n=1 Tax=Spirabiliibacterium pneumoniae TaxID=221400 RepID=UPI001AAC6990|nr:restriction endonuclease subunit S [Spirabiliibacterium pneumoniae]MBE2896385.1 restriction endonuclease subunit S [Spirabiliibacterium pneumoniae]